MIQATSDQNEKANLTPRGESYYGHPTVRIEITKFVDVDVEMVPVVQWLNSFENIETQDSCQGSPSKNADNDSPPYVAFTAGTADYELAQIVEAAQDFAIVEARHWRLLGLRHVIEFHDLDALRDFTATLNPRFRRPRKGKPK